ncbi:unnamed protein product [Mytilus edulis]|uniref:Uncharacterized protein n=1 Tax=Mytilus edulis TaxID=6550 RepID=A0A8S3SY42_MYTED|nr:unnamed protein product [Mytilus edulis]
MEIVKNADVMGVIYIVDDETCDHEQVSSTVVISVSTGDVVFIRTHSTLQIQGGIVSRTSGRSSFAGWLSNDSAKKRQMSSDDGEWVGSPKRSWAAEEKKEQRGKPRGRHPKIGSPQLKGCPCQGEAKGQEGNSRLRSEEKPSLGTTGTLPKGWGYTRRTLQSGAREEQGVRTKLIPGGGRRDTGVSWKDTQRDYTSTGTGVLGTEDTPEQNSKRETGVSGHMTPQELSGKGDWEVSAKGHSNGLQAERDWGVRPEDTPRAAKGDSSRITC